MLLCEQILWVHLQWAALNPHRYHDTFAWRKCGCWWKTIMQLQLCFGEVTSIWNDSNISTYYGGICICVRIRFSSFFLLIEINTGSDALRLQQFFCCQHLFFSLWCEFMSVTFQAKQKIRLHQNTIPSFFTFIQIHRVFVQTFNK